ncbi:hypothetical protein [Flavobacterium sp.]|uniref:hypothetical protein n=1 Tax=Flavobacterium sp. TaxID=239 RepID=UPI003753B3D6
MKKIKSIIVTLFILLPLFTLSSCEELFDCIASASPQLTNKNLAVGGTGNYYNDTITASVKNDSNDDAYGYFITVEGNLPTGMNYNIVGRNIHFQGTPTTSGTYSIKIILTIDPPSYYDSNGGFYQDDNRICFGNDTTQKTYSLVIN